MTQSARIKLTSKSLPKLVNVCDEIMNISKNKTINSILIFFITPIG